MRDFLSRPVASNLFKGIRFRGIIHRKEGYPPVQESYTIMKKYCERVRGTVLSVRHMSILLNPLSILSLSPSVPRLFSVGGPN